MIPNLTYFFPKFLKIASPSLPPNLKPSPPLPPMTTVDGGDDVEINPVTMLLLEADDKATLDNKSELVPTPVQHQTYHLISVASNVVIRQLPSQGLSFQLWPAATTFVNLLDRYQSSNVDPFSTAITTVKNRQRLRILELGSGTGVVGIAASAILGADVIVTDLPHVLPNLKFNAEANAGALTSRGGEVRVAALSWGVKEEMERIGREYEVIIGSDVVYHDNLYDPLIETLRFLLVDGGGGDGGEKVFLMAHLRRWKKESGFFKKAKKYFRVEVVHEDGPSSGLRAGVVVYRFARKNGGLR